MKKFIDRVQSKLNDSIADIYFFGGEPTINYPYITKIIKLFKEKKNNYQTNFIMHTNGLKFSEAPKNIVLNLDLALISINYEEIFDSKNNLTPYFYSIVKTINMIKKIKNFPMIGRFTISPNTSLFTELYLMLNLFDYIYWQLDNTEKLTDFDSYKEKYFNEIDLLFDYWLNFLEKGVFLKLVPFISTLNHILYETGIPKKFYCGYGTSMIYIQTNGKCYACCDNVNTNSHYIGDIWSGIEFKNNEIKDTICVNCNYLSLCGGRCGRMHKDFSKERIDQFCLLNKYMFDKILSNINKIKNLIKIYPDYEEKIKDKFIAYTEYTS